LTSNIVTLDIYNDFNSFLKLLYSLRDNSYLKENHKKIIINAIQMKNRLENNFNQN